MSSLSTVDGITPTLVINGLEDSIHFYTITNTDVINKSANPVHGVLNHGAGQITGLEAGWFPLKQPNNDETSAPRDHLVVATTTSLLLISQSDYLTEKHVLTKSLNPIMSNSCVPLTGMYSDNSFGVYESTTRVWKFRARDTVSCIACFDVDHDKELEFLIGYKNGTIEARRQRTGDVVWSEKISCSIQSLLSGSLRRNDVVDLIAIDENGNVHAFHPADTEVLLPVQSEILDKEKILQDLQTLKQTLLHDLENEGNKTNLVDSVAKSPKAIANDKNSSPSQFNSVVVHCALVGRYKPAEGALLLQIDIQSVPMPSGSPGVRLEIPIHLEEDSEDFLNVKLLMRCGNIKLRVLKFTLPVPKFAMHIITTEDIALTKSMTSFESSLSTKQISTWLQSRFLTSSKAMFKVFNNENIIITGYSIRESNPFKLEVNRGKIKITSDNIDLIGTLIQDFCFHFQLDNLPTHHHFPNHVKDLVELLEIVDDLNKARIQFQSSNSDVVNSIRMLMLVAEDRFSILD
ncbi:Bardet-Biedl syndrome 2 protein, partial [Blyttiomyces sp. JEL0837]